MKLNRTILHVSAVCLFAFGANVANGQSKLPLGKTESATTTSDDPSTYLLSVKKAGVLTVAIQGSGDLGILITDTDGQFISGGIGGSDGDRDLNGDTGKETITVIMHNKGDYNVQILDQSGDYSADFQITASFMEFEPFQFPEDTDGRPSQANVITLGSPSDETTLNNSEGDMYDWYKITATNSGSVIVASRPVNGSEGDLVLEAFYEDNFTTAEMTSDQDLKGNMANESLMIMAEAGQDIYIRVRGNRGTTDAEYKLSTAFME